jgi:hypothetical protein
MALEVEWRVVHGDLKPFVEGKEVIWAAQPGSQVAFLGCPVFEVLLEGTRGGGKTDTLIMDFAQHTGKGFGVDWRGVLFRQSYPQLTDVIAKSKKWFPRMFPSANYNESKSTWTWPTGEQLLFRQMETPDDYVNFHGHCVRDGEVLTPSGWKNIWSISPGDIVYSVDKNRSLVPLPVATVTHEMHEGELVRHRGRGTYMEFTPNHQIAVVAEDGSISPIPYKDTPRSVRIGRWVSWAGGTRVERFTAPEVEFQDRCHIKQIHSISGDDYCELMGWYLSEGYCSPKRIGIAQKKEPNRSILESLLKRCGFRYSSDKGGFTFASPRWSAWFSRFGKCQDKWVPDDIMSASVDQLRIFFEALVRGDGHRKGDSVYYYTTSKTLADQVSHIACKLGYVTSLTTAKRDEIHLRNYTVACRMSDRRDMHLLTDNRERQGRMTVKNTQVERVAYSGPVCCIGLPQNHMFLIRQRGCTWISGNSYPWIAFEELTTWPDDRCYSVMMSCSRSTRSGMPRKFRSTTNPYGIGHSWVKARFHLPCPPRSIVGKLINDEKDKDGILLPPRVAIHSDLSENRVLLNSDPGYRQKIRAAARNPSELRAWLYGDWDIVAGGMFDDVWNPSFHVVPDIRADMIPRGWRINRSYDHGQSRPFSVGWWAESNGEPIQVGRHLLGTIRGDLFRIGEWYGWQGVPNEGVRMSAYEIADGIRMREEKMGIRGRCNPGPADSSIYDDFQPGRSIAGDMQQRGIRWVPADKSAGSRHHGWEQMRKLLRNAMPEPNGPRHQPGMFICQNCTQFLRTVPVLPRDDKDLDDVDTMAEDHVADEARYRCREKRNEVICSSWI